VRRGQRIDELDLDEEPQAVAPVIPERKVSGGLFKTTGWSVTHPLPSREGSAAYERSEIA
jgi:hypothetical protein